jgi:hypothetical protein
VTAKARRGGLLKQLDTGRIRVAIRGSKGLYAADMNDSKQAHATAGQRYPMYC